MLQIYLVILYKALTKDAQNMKLLLVYMEIIVAPEVNIYIQ